MPRRLMFIFVILFFVFSTAFAPQLNTIEDFFKCNCRNNICEPCDSIILYIEVGGLEFDGKDTYLVLKMWGERVKRFAYQDSICRYLNGVVKIYKNGQLIQNVNFNPLICDESVKIRKLKVRIAKDEFLDSKNTYTINITSPHYFFLFNPELVLAYDKIKRSPQRNNALRYIYTTKLYLKRKIPIEYEFIGFEFVPEFKHTLREPNFNYLPMYGKMWASLGRWVYGFAERWVRVDLDSYITCEIDGKPLFKNKPWIKNYTILSMGNHSLVCKQRLPFSLQSWSRYKIYYAHLFFRANLIQQQDAIFWKPLNMKFKEKKPYVKYIVTTCCWGGCKWRPGWNGRYGDINFVSIDRLFIAHGYLAQLHPFTWKELTVCHGWYSEFCGDSVQLWGSSICRLGFTSYYPWDRKVFYRTLHNFKIFEREIRKPVELHQYLPKSQVVFIATNPNGTIKCWYNGEEVNFSKASEPFAYYLETEDSTELNELKCIVYPATSGLQYFYAYPANETLATAPTTFPFQPAHTFNVVPMSGKSTSNCTTALPALAVVTAAILLALSKCPLLLKYRIWKTKVDFYNGAAAIMLRRLEYKANKIAKDRNYTVAERKVKINGMVKGFINWLSEITKKLNEESKEFGAVVDFSCFTTSAASILSKASAVLQREARIEAAEIEKVEKYKNNGAAALRIIAAELTTKAAKDLAAFYIEGWDKIEGLKKQGYAIVDQVASFEETARNRNIYASVRREIFEFLLDGGELSDEAAKFVETGNFDGYAKELSQIVNAIKEVSKAYGIDATWVAGALQRRFDDVKGKIYDILDAEERMEEEECRKVDETRAIKDDKERMERLYDIRDNGELTTARARDKLRNVIQYEEVGILNKEASADLEAVRIILTRSESEDVRKRAAWLKQQLEWSKMSKWDILKESFRKMDWKRIAINTAIMVGIGVGVGALIFFTGGAAAVAIAAAGWTAFAVGIVPHVYGMFRNIREAMDERNPHKMADALAVVWEDAITIAASGAALHFTLDYAYPKTSERLLSEKLDLTELDPDYYPYVTEFMSEIANQRGGVFKLLWLKQSPKIRFVPISERSSIGSYNPINDLISMNVKIKISNEEYLVTPKAGARAVPEEEVHYQQSNRLPRLFSNIIRLQPQEGPRIYNEFPGEEKAVIYRGEVVFRYKVNEDRSMVIAEFKDQQNNPVYVLYKNPKLPQFIRSGYEKIGYRVDNVGYTRPEVLEFRKLVNPAYISQEFKADLMQSYWGYGKLIECENYPPLYELSILLGNTRLNSMQISMGLMGMNSYTNNVKK